jgi:hypothetical protein
MNLTKDPIKLHINHLLTFTVNLVALSDDKIPIGAGSGFIYYYKENFYVFTANHVRYDDDDNELQLFIETGFIKGNTNLCIPSGNPIFSDKDHDIVIYKFPLIALNDKDDGGEKPQLTFYRGPIEPPNKEEDYSFGANKYDHLLYNNGMLYNVRVTTTEVGLKMVGGSNGNFYKFKIDDPSKKKDYHGCSGSPIIARDGTLCSLLSHGIENEDEFVYGTNLSNIIGSIHATM